MPVYAVGQDGSPSSADVYYGNDGTIGREIKISTALDVRESNINDNYVVSNVSVDTRYLSEDVGVVTQTDDGFLLTTNSAYDEIPLVITYQNGTKGYVTIRRVGIDIVGKHFSDRNFGIAHGTDGVSEFTLPEEYSIDTSVDNQIVTAAFYYATGNTVPSEDERVSLSVTITRVDGTVERKMIPSEKRLNNDCLRANVGEDRYCDGFVLWAGSETEYNKIDKIEAIAFVAGNDDSFGGVQVGSGTGVTWYRR